MALQGKYKDLNTDEIYENAYWIIDSIHTEVVFNVDEIEENFIFVSMSVYENIEERNNRIDTDFDLSFEFQFEKSEIYGNLWEFSYNKVKSIIIEKMSDQLEDENYILRMYNAKSSCQTLFAYK